LVPGQKVIELIAELVRRAKPARRDAPAAVQVLGDAPFPAIAGAPSRATLHNLKALTAARPPG
jgi:hypothetical protein